MASQKSREYDFARLMLEWWKTYYADGIIELLRDIINDKLSPSNAKDKIELAIQHLQLAIIIYERMINGQNVNKN